MGQSVIQVDAFTDTPFQGNPAAVCILSAPQDDQWMQGIAKEMNLSETAFLIPQDSGFHLRWFTPTMEVPLCGHATLASAHVLWSEGYLDPSLSAEFYTQSGTLTARKLDNWIELNFPANPLKPLIRIPAGLEDALGAAVHTVMKNTSGGYLVEVASEAAVRQLHPSASHLLQASISDVIVTSQADPDSGFDIVSRYFAPGLGIDEDPVTGSAHCCLAPYWRDRLQKDTLLAYQASARGGIVKVHYDGGDRVQLLGQAVTVLRGEWSI
ncbi:PhzF family phenazine biosynthesis protein [Leptolyngbya sp. CCY15150]|uniref:PhzF family phenazine biosynthesis protein n=1 Tax=Leptolyngbya sp. CCY15150 TaxID=2767772 RepID=UPI00194F7147|nr:PhzF family phenazine biosynthesis protein [Leptolyngbya sp. CCY15150]